MNYENHLHHLGPYADSDHYAGVAAVIDRLAVPFDLPVIDLTDPQTDE